MKPDADLDNNQSVVRPSSFEICCAVKGESQVSVFFHHSSILDPSQNFRILMNTRDDQALCTESHERTALSRPS